MSYHEISNQTDIIISQVLYLYYENGKEHNSGIYDTILSISDIKSNSSLVFTY